MRESEGSGVEGHSAVGEEGERVLIGEDDEEVLEADFFSGECGFVEEYPEHGDAVAAADLDGLGWIFHGEVGGAAEGGEGFACALDSREIEGDFLNWAEAVGEGGEEGVEFLGSDAGLVGGGECGEGAVWSVGVDGADHFIGGGEDESFHGEVDGESDSRDGELSNKGEESDEEGDECGCAGEGLVGAVGAGDGEEDAEGDEQRGEGDDGEGEEDEDGIEVEELDDEGVDDAAGEGEDGEDEGNEGGWGDLCGGVVLHVSGV